MSDEKRSEPLFISEGTYKVTPEHMRHVVHNVWTPEQRSAVGVRTEEDYEALHDAALETMRLHGDDFNALHAAATQLWSALAEKQRHYENVCSAHDEACRMYAASHAEAQQLRKMLEYARGLVEKARCAGVFGARHVAAIDAALSTHTNSQVTPADSAEGKRACGRPSTQENGWCGIPHSQITAIDPHERCENCHRVLFRCVCSGTAKAPDSDAHHMQLLDRISELDAEVQRWEAAGEALEQAAKARVDRAAATVAAQAAEIETERDQLRAVLLAMTEPVRGVVLGDGETVTITATLTREEWRDVVALLNQEKSK